METSNAVWKDGLCRKLHKRSGVWFYYIRYKAPNGKLRMEKAGTSVSQARKKLAQRMGEVASGQFVDPRDAKKAVGPTFEEFIDQFLKEYASRTRSEYYKNALHGADKAKGVKCAPIRAYFAGRYVKVITTGDLERYATHCRLVNAVGPSTVRKRLTLLGTMLRWGKRAGILDSNPATDVEKPSEPHHKTRFLTAEEWEDLHAEAEPWLRPILTVAIHTGMRLKEVVGLQWAGVDWDASLLFVSEDCKTAKPRAVPMTRTVRALLEQLGGRFRKAGYVFVDGDGKGYTAVRERNRVSQRTKAAAEAAGLTGVTFHTLRHTAGSWMAQAGQSQVTIAKVLGHASTATTDRYMHLAPEHLKGAVDAIEKASLATQTATCSEPASAPAAATGGSATLPAGYGLPRV